MWLFSTATLFGRSKHSPASSPRPTSLPPAGLAPRGPGSRRQPLRSRRGDGGWRRRGAARSSPTPFGSTRNEPGLHQGRAAEQPGGACGSAGRAAAGGAAGGGGGGDPAPLRCAEGEPGVAPQP